MLWEQTLVEGKGAPVWQGWLKSHDGGRSPPEQQCVHPSEPPAELQNVSRLRPAESRQMSHSINNTGKVHNVSCVKFGHQVYSRKGCRCILACCCSLDAGSCGVHHLTLSNPQICLSSLQLLVQLLADIICLLEPVEGKHIFTFCHTSSTMQCLQSSWTYIDSCPLYVSQVLQGWHVDASVCWFCSVGLANDISVRGTLIVAGTLQHGLSAKLPGGSQSRF
jgi:hypothetical protein